MSSSTKAVLDAAFLGAGQKIGVEIWRIEDFKPVPLQKSDYGKFYSGDSYIVLQTSSGKGGAYSYDIHFWIGKDSSQDEAGTAAIKTVELDAVLGGRAIQHREIQGHESEKFLSYFKPCIIPMEGGFATGFKKHEDEKFQVRLYTCRGKHYVRIKEVAFSRSSLNHDDVFILDTENKIYQFNGANSNIQERAKALEVVQHLKEKYHEGTCEVAVVDDGKLAAESDSGDFWVLFGGFAPIGRKAVGDDDVLEEAEPKFYSVEEGHLKIVEAALTKAMLENNKCYMLDCGAEIFVWVGRVTHIDERKNAIKLAEELIINENRPKATRITQMIQSYETPAFKSKFESWPVGTGSTTTAGGEEGRGIVAALLKQQGVDTKGQQKSLPAQEDVPPLLEENGKLEVWCINGNAKNSLSAEEIGKFYGGDCYIVLYTYHSSEKKEEYYLCCWIGKDSTQEDQDKAAQLANAMWNSLRGRPVQGRVYQGKEPPQFIALFQPMVVLTGGISSGYKKFLAENNLKDENYIPEGIALFHITGTSAHNHKALQVEPVATSLSSTDCFVLLSGSSLFTWFGNQSSHELHQWAIKVAEFLKPGVAAKSCKEGAESGGFWFALGGKKGYTSKSAPPDIIRDPHLYTFLFKNGKIKVDEVYNFSQDDLLTEDMLILDTHAEIFIWIGHSVDSKEKQKAFDIGQSYIEHAISCDGLSPDVPLYKVTEGNEPIFFKIYFSWDNIKSLVQGNSYQKKLSILFGMRASESNDKSKFSSNGGPTQRASALAALSSAFNPASQEKPNSNERRSSDGGPTQRAAALAALSSAFKSTAVPKAPAQPTRSTQGSSQRAAAVAALSSVLTAEQSGASGSPGHNKSATSLDKLSTDSTEDQADAEHSEAADSSEELVETAREASSEVDGEDHEASQEKPVSANGEETTFSYERLRVNSTNPVRGIDYKQREVYLSDGDFKTVFRMTKEAFYQQPRWKQEMQKRKADLF